jgi:SAM-dependent methyltransferase
MFVPYSISDFIEPNVLFYRCRADKKAQNMTQLLHPAAQHGFSAAAELYQQVRPSYPQEIHAWLTEQLHLNANSHVIDLASGTGKFLPYLIPHSGQLTAIEPVTEMLAQLKLAYPLVETLQAFSDHMPLPSQSIDAVLSAQAFHWFANLDSLKEIHRVLKPQGHLGLVWNQRDTQVDWVNALAECEYIVIYDPYCPEDRAHYEKLQTVVPNLNTLNLPFTGHDAIAVLASSDLLHDFLRHEFDAPYFYKKIREVKKNSKFYYRKVIENLLPRHRFSLGRILKNNELELDGQFFDAKLKQSIIRELLSNRQVSQTDLLKLGIQVNLPQENSCQLMDSFGHGLVFNMISQKIESYAPDAIALNHKFLLPIFAKGNGLVHIYYNDMRYTVVMNDRQIMKLVHEQAELSTGMHPLLMKKYSDYYLISYKQFNFSCDEYGGFDLVEDIPETAQFLVSSDAESDVFL